MTNGKDLNIIRSEEIAEGWVRVYPSGIAYGYYKLKDGRVFSGEVSEFTTRDGRKFKDGEWKA